MIANIMVPYSYYGYTISYPKDTSYLGGQAAICKQLFPKLLNSRTSSKQARPQDFQLAQASGTDFAPFAACSTCLVQQSCGDARYINPAGTGLLVFSVQKSAFRYHFADNWLWDGQVVHTYRTR